MNSVQVQLLSQVSKKNGQHITVIQEIDSSNVIIRLDYFDDMVGSISISKRDAVKIANDILKKAGVRQ